MKRAIIVHCWEGYPEYCWYQSAKKVLEAKGYQVEVPAFPDTEAPDLSKWFPKLKEVISTPDTDLCLIGHSVGCITILRYLEQLKEPEKVGKVVLVAGFTNDLGFNELKNFFTTPINFEYIKTKSESFTAIHSDDDPYVSLDHGDIFKEGLGANLIIKHNMKHFSGHVDNEDSCTDLPEVVESVV